MRQTSLGLITGFAIAFVVVGVLGIDTIVKKKKQATDGWDLRPVVVAAQDVPAGTALTFDMLSQRSIPSQFMSSAYVMPNQAGDVIGKKTAALVQAGDPITWQIFASVPGRDLATECATAIRPAVEAASQKARDEAVDAFVKRAGPTEPVVPTSGSAPGLPPLPPPDADGNVAVVTVNVELKEGTVLTAAMLEAKPWPQEFVTPSYVGAPALSDVVGTLVTVPMQKGDALHWQFLDSVKSPRSVASCTTLAARAADAAMDDAAKTEAAAFFKKRGMK